MERSERALSFSLCQSGSVYPVLSSTPLLLSRCRPERVTTNVGHLGVSIHPPKSMLPDTGPCPPQERPLDVTDFQAGHPLPECLRLVCSKEDMSEILIPQPVGPYHRSPSVWTRVPTCPMPPPSCAILGEIAEFPCLDLAHHILRC